MRNIVACFFTYLALLSVLPVIAYAKNPGVDEQLIEAILDNNLSRVTELTRSGASPNNANIPGSWDGVQSFYPPAVIVAAVNDKNFDILKFLVEEGGANINARSNHLDFWGRSREGRTAIMQVVYNWQWVKAPKNFAYLLSKNPDLSLFTITGKENILSSALLTKDNDIVSPLWERVNREVYEDAFARLVTSDITQSELLIQMYLQKFAQQGIDLNKKYSIEGYEISLISKAILGSWKTLEIVLNNGGDPNQILSQSDGDVKYSVTILERLRTTDGHNEDELVLKAALLMSRGAKITLEVFRGTVSGGLFKLADLYLKNGIDVNGEVKGVPLLFSRRTPRSDCFLAELVRWNKIDALKYLIRNGLDVKNYFQNETPLVVVVKESEYSAAFIKLLVASGADINAPDLGSGMTPLIISAANSNYNSENLVALMEIGADTSKVDNHHRTALLTLIHHFNWQSSLSLEIFKELILRSKPVINSQGSGGLSQVEVDSSYSALHLLVLQYWQFKVKGNLPIEVAKLLLSAGIDKNLMDSKGRTALDLARISEAPGIDQLIKILTLVRWPMIPLKSSASIRTNR